MIRTASIFGALSLALVAMPAAAASDAFIAGTAAYNEAFASDVRPSEPSDFAYCTGYWEAWGTAVSDEVVPEAELEVLDVALKPPSPYVMAIAMVLDLEDSAEITMQIDIAKEEANQLITDTLGGNVGAAESLFRSLGTCHYSDE